MNLNVWQFLGGLGLFIYALALVESSLRTLVGRSFKKIILKYSEQKFLMMMASVGITAIMQSSAIVLLVLSFVGAGLMTLRGSLAAVLGSNLGTTFNSWILAFLGFRFNLDTIVFPLLSTGLIGLLILRKNEKGLSLSHFFIGFGLIFMSLNWLKSSMLFTDEWTQTLSGIHFVWFIPLGFLITAIIQSSSATIVLGLTALYNQIIPFEHIAALVIGSELGTTVKFLIGSYGSLPDKKRVAWGNFIINLLTLLIAALGLIPLIHLIKEVIGIQDNMLAIVFFQSGINFMSILLFYPFINRLARWLESWYRQENVLTKYLRVRHHPSISLDLVLGEKELLYLLDRSLDFTTQAFGADSKNKLSRSSRLAAWLQGSQALTEKYQTLKGLLGEILEWLTEIPKDNQREQEVIKADKMIMIGRHILRAVKNIKDIRHNLQEFEDSSNDTLFEQTQKIKTMQIDFYNSLQKTIQNNQWQEFASKAAQANIENRKMYDQSVLETLSFLRDKKISEITSTSMMNIHREIYSSNKALLEVMIDLEVLNANSAS